MKTLENQVPSCICPTDAALPASQLAKQLAKQMINQPIDKQMDQSGCRGTKPTN